MIKLKNIIVLVLFISYATFGQTHDHKADLLAIKENTKQFSEWYVEGNFEAMAKAYTVDGKIFPDRANIIEGHEAIEKRWTLPEGVSIINHVVTPEEIEIVDNTAYDYGYYEGSTKMLNGDISNWKGKYVIVWKKIDEDWKMYLDIWNRVDD